MADETGRKGIKRGNGTWISALSVLVVAFCFDALAQSADWNEGKRPVSKETLACLECHKRIFPGIVADWEKSRMARVTPAAAASMVKPKRRVSFETPPERLARVVVGCAECHTMNAQTHLDSFDHNGFKVHVVVTPSDCATCHPEEVGQYSENVMSEAYGNLQDNYLYKDMADQANGIQELKGLKIMHRAPDADTEADSCLYCHGTVVEVRGSKTRETSMGEMAFPILSGWPNRGVGRINPDGSKGACTACHTRHQFAIQMARKPYTCSECHKGPDVPAYKVYSVSKHGSIFSGMGKEKSWDFDNVPWEVGKDFGAPTCAACHVSLLVKSDGSLVAERTHRMNDRLAWRIMGLIYAHPHPVSPATAKIRNKAGLPLPTELTGEPVAGALIGAQEQAERRTRMVSICRACHSRPWVEGQFARFENAIQTANAATRTATRIVSNAWEEGLARGVAQGGSAFDEAIERMWVEEWLFFANSVRYGSAMVGADYGVFADGRWYLSKNIRAMCDWLEFKRGRQD